ncbi:MAG: hypothetical protein NZ958_08635 [Bacteroidia bacterium]|nr:hypothetical protein [Bacteroidia bacterium]MDW8089755.1 hypothetical protein [Bacteroidia bacterium]
MRPLFFCALLSAQPLPDTVYFIGAVAGDTLAYTAYKAFSGGWTAWSFSRHQNTWQLQACDSFWVDSLGRLTLHLSLAPEIPNLIPRWRHRLAYSLDRGVICTRERYEPAYQTFVPQQRIYVWGIAPRWDSLLMGWFGVLALNLRPETGDTRWPFPTLHTQSLWGDSLLLENFLPDFSLFVETGGYLLGERFALCDSFYQYLSPRANPQIIGSHIRCYDNRLLIAQRDTFCLADTCIAQTRTLSYDGASRLHLDSLGWRVYTRQGQPLRQGELRRRYLWQSSTQPLQAEYPGGTFIWKYSTQMVTLPLAPKAFRLVGRRGWVEGMLCLTPLHLFDLAGRCLWEAHPTEDGYFELPETLSSGLYLLEIGGSWWKVFLP